MEDQTIPVEDPKPDYYMTAMSRVDNKDAGYVKDTSYTLVVFEGTNPAHIAVQDLKKEMKQVTYTSFKALFDDWAHINQLINYKP